MKGNRHAILFRLLALLVLVAGVFMLFLFERGSSALRQARLAEQQQEFQSAAKLYNQASRVLFWDRVALRVKAAQNAARAGDSGQVIDLLSPLQKAELLPYPGQVLLASAYLATDRLDAAMALRQEWIEKGYPTAAIDPELLKRYTEQGRLRETLPILRTLVSAQPQNAEWQYRLGLILAAESPQEAAQPLQRAAQLDPNYQPTVSILAEQLKQPSSEAVLVYLYSGRGLAMIGEWKLAELAFEHAVELRPDFAEAWAYLGLARFRQAPVPQNPLLQKQTPIKENDLQRKPPQKRPGLTELRYALQLNPRSQVALAFLTLYWLELGETQLALQSAQQAFAFYPNELPVRFQYAQALAQNGDLADGWQILNEWISKSPDRLAARKALVRYCVQYGYRLAESALPIAQEMAEQLPKDAETLDLLGQVYLGLEEWTLAQQTFERALSLDASYAPAWLHLGIVHLEQGTPSLAQKHFQKVIEISPFSPSGEQAKRYLETYLP